MCYTNSANLYNVISSAKKNKLSRSLLSLSIHYQFIINKHFGLNKKGFRRLNYNQIKIVYFTVKEPELYFLNNFIFFQNNSKFSVTYTLIVSFNSSLNKT